VCVYDVYIIYPDIEKEVSSKHPCMPCLNSIKKDVYTLKKHVYSIKRALYSANRALYSGKRTLYSGGRALYSGERASYSGKRALQLRVIARYIEGVVQHIYIYTHT